ncbi:MAG: ROK family protein, partial [Micromonosporaceae bacterium]
LTGEPSRAGDVLALIRAGAATSRADVARLVGVSASTASARVESLIRRGMVREDGDGPSRGGRRPRRLLLEPGLGTVAALDVGADSATIALANAAGEQLASRQVPIRLADGPLAVLGVLSRQLDRMRDPGTAKLLAACIGVPGPVGPARDVLVAAARMPGWNGADVRALAQASLGVPTIVENDANLVALGERALHRKRVGDLVAVKVATGIGCGVVVGGRLHRGADGMAGDISHTAVPGAPATPCSCGRTGCLDVVASGSAVLEAIRDSGVEVAGVDQLLRLVNDGHPVATNLLRGAGERIGAVLATVVSFFNPSVLVLAGQVSRSPAFVSAVTSTVYGSCLPATTTALEIVLSEDSTRSSLRGATGLALDGAFADENLARLLASGAR